MVTALDEAGPVTKRFSRSACEVAHRRALPRREDGGHPVLPSEDEMADCPPQLAAHTTPDELLSDRGWAEPLVGQLGFAREGARPNNASSDMHAADRTPGTLPHALTPLIGREREVAAAELVATVSGC